jgi:GMP synthase (glutamine-hydrolysing)
MNEKIIIFDFGSQYTQLIARRVREQNVYSEIIPYFKPIDIHDTSIKGIIFSGSPFSCLDENAPKIDYEKYLNHFPILSICYSAQYAMQHLGGKVHKSSVREYGRAAISIQPNCDLFKDIDAQISIWMSHSDSIQEVGSDFEIVAKTDNQIVAAFQSKAGIFQKPFYGLQFHPEVTHSEKGSQLFQNFIQNICKCKCDWTPNAFIEEQVALYSKSLENQKVVLGLSGGVDSSVAAFLLHRAIGKNLFCIFIDNGLLRKNEFTEVLESYKECGLNVIGVDAKSEFYEALNNVEDPETKRKAIGRVFIEIFEKEAKKIQDVSYLAQGTIYPDVIESISVHGPSVTIKSHHNVGGLPDKLGLKIVEPLRSLFKDEVRNVGKELGVPLDILNRHPFPGPGLGIRIIGAITESQVAMLQEADAIFTKHLKDSGWYDKVWQSGAILLPVKSVGVMGDERTYEQVVALRCVHSVDGMTADWVHLPYELLAKISNEIINKVKGINRVVYDISSKPPATIEWE